MLNSHKKNYKIRDVTRIVNTNMAQPKPQPNPSHWIWKAYIPILALFLTRKAVLLFSDEMPHRLYYEIMYAFNPHFYFQYLCNLAQTIFSALHIIPLVCYVYKRKVLSTTFWQAMFLIKIFFDLTGHAYEMSYLTSLYHQSLLICIIISISSIATYIPLYVACFRYAFKREKVLGG